MCTGVLVPARILIEDFVVISYGRLVVTTAVVEFTQIKLRVARTIGVGVELQILGELLRRQIILAAVKVSQRAVVERVRRRGLSLGLRVDRYAAGCLTGWRIFDVLAGSPKIGGLPGGVRPSSLEFVSGVLHGVGRPG